jgi:ADP-ribose pyrophosphatase
MREHGPWKIRSTKEVYRDPWVSLTADDVIRPDGKPGTFSVVGIKPGVCVIAVDEAGVAHLTEEFRYAVGRPSIEGVGGGIDDGEEPLAAAKRELREELGINAAEWTPLGVVDPFTSMVRCPIHLYLARRLTFGPHSPDGTELVKPMQMPFAEAVRAVSDGRITHAPSCVAILQTAARLGTQPSPAERMPGRRIRALIVEDNVDAAESLSLLLEQLGCEAMVANDGPAGVEAARTSPPDIVFCDIGLPGLDGYAVARSLRSESWGSRVVLVAVTGYGRDEDRRQAEAAGFDMHFVKPADPEAITRLFKDLSLPG